MRICPHCGSKLGSGLDRDLINAIDALHLPTIQRAFIDCIIDRHPRIVHQEMLQEWVWDHRSDLNPAARASISQAKARLNAKLEVLGVKVEVKARVGYWLAIDRKERVD